jgi:hypothetical protein
MSQRKYRPVFELSLDRFCDIRVAMSQRDREQAANEINIFIAVDIPDAAARAPGDEIGETPQGYWTFDLEKVWLPRGMLRSARSRNSSDFR